MRRRTCATCDQERESLAAVGVPSLIVPRERLREEIGTDAYHGALVVPDSGLLHPGRYFAGLAEAADRAGADLHEGVRCAAVRRQADGRFVVETERGAILARDVFVATNGYTDGVGAIAAPTDHPDRELHHRQRAAARGPRPRALAEGPRRSSTRRTSSTTGTSRPTAG